MDQTEAHTQKSSTQKASDGGRVALLFCADLFFGVQLQKMAQACGFRPVTWRPGSPLPAVPAHILVVDLGARGDWEAAIRDATAQGMRVVAFGPHMDAEARKRAKEAGATRVLTNSNLARDLPKILAAFNSGQEQVVFLADGEAAKNPG